MLFLSVKSCLNYCFSDLEVKGIEDRPAAKFLIDFFTFNMKIGKFVYH
jgi:hypothetical protein